MKKQIEKNCYAKVNLSLDVIGKREGGYHNLEMIMQTVSLKDILTVSVDTDVAQTRIEVRCSNCEVPQNEDNLVAKSARLFLERTNITANIKSYIDKNIPMGAGLGGGSSDAAGMLEALNECFGYPLAVEELAKIAGDIGSDVPFFLCGKAMFAEGTGTTLSEVTALKGAIIVIAKPKFSVSTPYVYKNLKLNDSIKHPDTKKVIEALEKNDLKMLAENAGNVLETVTATEHKEIEEYKSIMLERGAVYALMSGSGPSVFGVFESEKSAETAYARLEKLTDEVYMTKTIQPDFR